MIPESSMIGLMRNKDREQNQLRDAYGKAYKQRWLEAMGGEYPIGMSLGNTRVPTFSPSTQQDFGIVSAGKAAPLMSGGGGGGKRGSLRDAAISAVREAYLSRRSEADRLKGEFSQMHAYQGEPFQKAQQRINEIEDEISRFHSTIGYGLQNAPDLESRENIREFMAGGGGDET